MPITLDYSVDAGTLANAISVLASQRQLAIQRQQELEAQQVADQAALAKRRQDLSEAEFGYRKESDVAQRQHARDMVQHQADAWASRDELQHKRQRELEQFRTEEAIRRDDALKSGPTRRALQQLDQAEAAIYASPDFSDEERFAALEQIAQQREQVQKAQAITAASPHPKGQDVGDLWEAAPGLWVTRNSKGEIVLINRMDQQDIKLADFSKLYESASAALTGPNGEPPDPAAVEARVQAQLTAFQKIKNQSRGPAAPGGLGAPGTPMPDVGPSSNPVTGPNFQGTPLPPPIEPGSTPQTMGAVRMRDAELAAASVGPASGRSSQSAAPAATPDQLRQQEQARRASLVPPTHWITKLPAAQRLPSKVADVDSFTPAELATIAIQKNMPIDMVIAKLVGGDIALRHGQQTAQTRQRRYQEQRP